MYCEAVAHRTLYTQQFSPANCLDKCWVSSRVCRTAILTVALSVLSYLQRESSTTFWALQKRTVWERSSTGDGSLKPALCVCVHQVVCVTNMWLSGLAVSAVKDASSWATAASCPTSPSAPESMTMMLLSGKFRQTEEELSAVTFSNLSTSCPLQVYL